MVIGQKKYTGNDDNLEKRVIEIIGEKSMVRSFENGLKNFQEKKDYLIFDNGLGEKVYTVYSLELKKGIREALKGFIRISNVGNEEFVVKVNQGSEEDMENFDFGSSSSFDKKDRKNQITYLPT